MFDFTTKTNKPLSKKPKKKQGDFEYVNFDESKDKFSFIILTTFP